MKKHAKTAENGANVNKCEQTKSAIVHGSNADRAGARVLL